MQHKYVEKWKNCFKTNGEFKVSLRLPHGQKTDCWNASAKVKFEKCITWFKNTSLWFRWFMKLYLALGVFQSPSSIFTIRPWKYRGRLANQWSFVSATDTDNRITWSWIWPSVSFISRRYHKTSHRINCMSVIIKKLLLVIQTYVHVYTGTRNK